MSATPNQRAYIEVLARELHIPVPKVETFEEASREIEDLKQQRDEVLKRQPITEATNRAFHAKLRDSKWTREDVKKALGIASLKASEGCTEWHGREAIKKLDESLPEVVRAPAPAGTFVEQLAAEDRQERRPAPRRPLRPLTNPHRPPGPEVTVREPPAPATRPADVPGIRMPRRPGRPAQQQTAPILAIKLLPCDPGHEAAMEDARKGIAPKIKGPVSVWPAFYREPLVRSVLEQFPGAEIVAVHHSVEA